MFDPKAMREFAQRFSKNDWEKLCEFQDFINIIQEDLGAARILAEKILAKKFFGQRIDWRLNPYV